MSLPTRKLGRNGPDVTAIGFGLMGLSTFYGTTGSDETRLAFLDHLYNTGVRNWDTADMYGDSEDLVGKWFAKNPQARKDIFLASKFAVTPTGINTSPAYVHQACAKSLKRLQVDHIDLYYMHRVDDVTPIEDTIEAMVELKNQGKIRYLGLSEISANTLRRAHAVHPISALQIEYSPFETLIEGPPTNLMATCRELGVAIVAYAPLGRGLLTGRYRKRTDFEEGDWRRVAPRFSDENFPLNLKLVDEITAIAATKGCTAGQLSLAWLLAQGDDVIPIPGTKRIPYADENMGALKVKLTDAEIAQIRKAVDAATPAGDRYTSNMMGTLVRDSVPKK